MIFGIGTDVVQIERIAKLHERYGERFVKHLLMPEEEGGLRAAHARPARYLAMRFAAKEAIVKAMGTGFAHGMWIRDCGIAANAWGRPEAIWSVRGRQMCAQLGIGESHVTLTDEAGLVIAVAILMKRVDPPG
jgi:holo-[acyl-carrier protein] synthase